MLHALIAGRPIDDIADSVRPYHDTASTYPAGVLLDLAADAYVACGSSRGDRLVLDGLPERMIPEDPLSPRAFGATWELRQTLRS